jgi:hypothetical protein
MMTYRRAGSATLTMTAGPRHTTPSIRETGELFSFGERGRNSLSLTKTCAAPSTSARLGCLRLSLSRRTPPREPRPSAITAGSARQATSSSTEFRRQTVLSLRAYGPRNLMKIRALLDFGLRGSRRTFDLGSFCEEFGPGWKRSLILVTPETVVRWHTDRLSAVLELDLASSKGGRKKTYQQGSARADLSDGR